MIIPLTFRTLTLTGRSPFHNLSKGRFCVEQTCGQFLSFLCSGEEFQGVDPWILPAPISAIVISFAKSEAMPSLPLFPWKSHVVENLIQTTVT